MAMTEVPDQKENKPTEPFWRGVGFVWDPFEQVDAAHEAFLEEYFVEPPQFWMMRERRHAVLYAPEGGGKTAARVMLASLCAAGEIADTMVVTCNDFSRVLRKARNKPKAVTVDMLIEEIMRQAAKCFFRYWMNSIEAYQQSAKLHRRWVAQFLPDEWEEACDRILQRSELRGKISLNDIRAGPSEELKAMVGEKLWPWVEMLATTAVLKKEELEQRTATEWLETLVATARQLEFEAVYLLFDQLDGLEVTKNPEGCAALIRSLLNTKDMFTVEGVYFKCFLPSETQRLLMSTEGIQSKRVAMTAMNWDTESLSQMLHKRLSAASEGKIASLAAISEAEIKAGIENELIKHAQTPRELCEFGALLFNEHERFSPQSTQLTRDDLDGVLGPIVERKLHACREDQHKVAYIILAFSTFLAFLLAELQTRFELFLVFVFCLAGQIISYLLMNGERRAQGKEEYKLTKLFGSILLELSLPLLIIVALPSSLPAKYAGEHWVDEFSLSVSSDHPVWGIWGGESELYLTVQGLTHPVTTTLVCETGAIMWPNGPAIQWAIEDSGKTKSVLCRFRHPGEVKYSINVEGRDKRPVMVPGGQFAVALVPAPLITRLIAAIGILIGAMVQRLEQKQIDSLLNSIEKVWKRFVSREG